MNEATGITQNSQVFLMDCVEGMKQYPDNHFDLAIVDPPYGIGITNSGWVKSNKKIKTENNWDSEVPKIEYWNELFRVSKNQIVWGGNYFIEHLKNTRCFVIWDKQIGECTSFASAELAWTSFNESTKTIYEHPAKHGKTKIHPTQKPIYLYDWCLNRYAKPNDFILDTHLGSGSSRIAAYKGGFNFVGFEIDKEYFDAAEKRYQQHIAQLTMF